MNNTSVELDPCGLLILGVDRSRPNDSVLRGTLIVGILVWLPVCLGNGLVLYVLITNKRLHTTSNVLITFLTLTDLCTGLIAIPGGIVSKVSQLTNKPNCVSIQVTWTCTALLCGISFYTSVLVTLERGLAILCPFKYNLYITKKKLVVSCVVLWVVWSVFSILEIIYPLEIRHWMLFGITTIPLCLLIVLIINIKICLVAQRHRR